MATVYKVKKPNTGATIEMGTSNTMVLIKAFGLQAGTDRTVYASWEWSESHTRCYKVDWNYITSDGRWFNAVSQEQTDKESLYTAPENAIGVTFNVKPFSTTYKVKKKDVHYWTAQWCGFQIYYFSQNPPDKPSSHPDVSITNLKLTASVSNLTGTGKQIEFQVVRDDKTLFYTQKVDIVTRSASISCNVAAGSVYKVRCRSLKDGEASDWTDYSSNCQTPPNAPEEITSLKALSDTSVQINWTAVSNATSYKIEYTTDTTYFDSSTSNVQTTTVESVVNHSEITGMESGREYFFRVRAVNSQGESGPTKIKSIIIGKKPAAPTTWSSTTTVVIGENLYLYWIHNTEDSSSQTLAKLELTANGVKTTYDITGNGEYKIDKDGVLSTIKSYTSDDDKDKTTSVYVDVSAYSEGAKLQWRVRTAGVTKEYGDWSVQRTVDIYAPPTLELSMTDKDENLIDVLTSFPFYLSGLAGPNTQAPIGYSVTITSNQAYETIDQIGNTQIINKNQVVYSNYFDTSNMLLVEFSAGNIDLGNNISYTITCVVSMDSGLTAESKWEFSVRWTDKIYSPNVAIGYDDSNYSTLIRPYCKYYPYINYKVTYDSTSGIYVKTDEVIESIEGEAVPNALTETMEQVYSGTDSSGETIYYCIVRSGEAVLVEGITLSVYRREFDGTFTEIATGLDNIQGTYVTDPHPALDYARYRIVAISESTGAVSFYDPPGYPIGEDGAIIQWDEEWSNFIASSVDEADSPSEPTWTGSLLRLPYNVDVSDSTKPDVSLVGYVGRKYPVSYYGTQLGSTATWNMEIPKDDEETLYGIRRLAIWMGDVYVREPSGSGYWANVNVSFSQKHRELTIPITLTITRVEGGI